jgi:hypothetical protein
MLRATIIGLPLVPSINEDFPEGAREFWNVAAKDQSLEPGFYWPIGDKSYAQTESNFDYSSLAPGLDTVQLHALINRVSALPEGSELLRDLDAEFGELARNPQPKSLVTTAAFCLPRDGDVDAR